MIVIFGGRGVIGSAITETLRAAGREVVVVTHNTGYASAPGFRYGDMLRPETLGPALEGAEVVIQSANFPTYPIEKPRRQHTFMSFDGLGTERLVAAAEAYGARRYIYISGVGTRADSPRPYFQAIWRGEQAVLNSKLAGVCIRPAFVYGPQDRGLNRILRAAKISPFIPVVGGGRQLHQPVYVGDVAEVVRQAVEADGPTGAYEVGGPQQLTLEDMLKTLFQIVGLRRYLLSVPQSLARFGGSVLQTLPYSLLSSNAIDFIAEDFIADTGPLLANFHLKLTPFQEGLQTYLQARRG